MCNFYELILRHALESVKNLLAKGGLTSVRVAKPGSSPLQTPLNLAKWWGKTRKENLRTERPQQPTDQPTPPLLPRRARHAWRMNEWIAERSPGKILVTWNTGDIGRGMLIFSFFPPRHGSSSRREGCKRNQPSSLVNECCLWTNYLFIFIFRFFLCRRA